MSYDGSRGVLGIGLVLRGPGRRSGPVIEEHAEAWSQVPAVSDSAFATLRALETARERGWRVVRVRSPFNAERTRFERMYCSGAGGEGRPLEAAVLQIARSFEIVQFRWVPRRKNQQARALAHEALTEATPRMDHPSFAGLPARPSRARPAPAPIDDWSWPLGELDEDRRINDGSDDDEIPF